MNLGIDELLRNPELRTPIEGRRCALLGHPTSVTSECAHPPCAVRKKCLQIYQKWYIMR